MSPRGRRLHEYIVVGSLLVLSGVGYPLTLWAFDNAIWLIPVEVLVGIGLAVSISRLADHSTAEQRRAALVADELRRTPRHARQKGRLARTIRFIARLGLTPVRLTPCLR
jgi:hypothetical protein